MSKNSRKNYDYFAFFCESASNARRAAEYLHETFETFNHATFRARMDGMHLIEHECDALKHTMMQQLSREFITPIEREDIVSLAQELDNVTDMIDDVMRRMYMFDVRRVRPEALAFSALIINCCKALECVMAELHSFKTSKTIQDLIVRVNTLESDGDNLHAESVRRIFVENTDAREAVVWSAIFDVLENCLDACEDAADIVEEVIMKNC